MKESKKKMKVILIMSLYMCCSAMGLVLIKMGVNKGFGISLENNFLQIKFGVILIVGMLLYVTSFLLSLFAMSKLDLNYFYPISSGMIYIFVCVLSVVLLKENISKTAICGMILILAGVVVMNFPDKL